jgi:hypothetical protein
MIAIFTFKLSNLTAGLTRSVLLPQTANCGTAMLAEGSTRPSFLTPCDPAELQRSMSALPPKADISPIWRVKPQGHCSQSSDANALERELTHRLDRHGVLDLREHPRTNQDLPGLCAGEPIMAIVSISSQQVTFSSGSEAVLSRSSSAKESDNAWLNRELSEARPADRDRGCIRDVRL